MPRFQLLVREPGKEPRVVSLGDPFVVGRSRNADLCVEDEEVGRKQFRIGVTSGFVVLEGLGTTNPTRIDESTIAAGERTTLAIGATIRVGKTTFEVQSADTTEGATGNPGDVIERTMVAPGPAGARPTPQPPAPAPQSPPPAAPRATPPAAPPAAAPAAADEVPMNTMELKRPGAGSAARPPAAPPASPAPGTQMFRPGAMPPLDQTAAGARPGAGNPPSESGYEQTMQLGPGGFRPGGTPPAASPRPTPPAPQPPAAKPPAAMPPAAKPPAAPAPAAARPAPPPPPPPAAPTPPPPAATPVPKAATPPPPAPQPASAAAPAKERPKTVAMRPEDLAPAPTTAMLGSEGESRLHSSVPRLFVKSEGLKRRVRLMKACNRVGRAENADVLLPHESVSELHAEISFDGEQWSLQDMGSTNGTIVDGNHLRRTSQPLRRNSLIGMGALHVIFLCVDAGTAAQDRRDEERALGLMVRSGRLTKGEASQIRRLCRADSSQSIAETLMMETALKPVDWANAVATARSKVSLWSRILGIFSRR